MHEANGLLARDNVPHSVTRQDKEVIFRLDNDLKNKSKWRSGRDRA